MKEAFQQWLQQTGLSGNLLAGAIRFPDRSTTVQSRFDLFSQEKVDQAIRCLADLFPSMQMNRLDLGRLRWIYANALLHVERRPDGICFALFTSRELTDLDAIEVERLFTEFRGLKSAGH